MNDSDDSLSAAHANPYYESSRKLLDAASYGLVDKITAALASGGDPDFAPNGISSTLIAVTREFPDALAVLLKAGASSSVPNRFGWTALHKAAENENPVFLDLILAAPTPPRLTVISKEGVSALAAALEKKRYTHADKLAAACPRLLALSDQDGVNLALQSVLARDEEALRWCLQAGVDPVKADSAGRSAFSESALKWPTGHVAIVQHTAATPAPFVQASPLQSVEPVADDAPNPFGFAPKRR